MAPSERVGDRAVSDSQLVKSFFTTRDFRDFRESVIPKLATRLGFMERSGKVLLEAGRVSPLCRSRDSDRWSHLFFNFGGIPLPP